VRKHGGALLLDPPGLERCTPVSYLQSAAKKDIAIAQRSNTVIAIRMRGVIALKKSEHMVLGAVSGFVGGSTVARIVGGLHLLSANTARNGCIVLLRKPQRGNSTRSRNNDSANHKLHDNLLDGSSSPARVAVFDWTV
jgi:hypothetical protein